MNLMQSWSTSWSPFWYKILGHRNLTSKYFALQVWSDQGKKPTIERCRSDGSHRVILVDKDVKWVNGLTIDHVTKRIHWVDWRLCVLESIDYDGNNRKRILQSYEYLTLASDIDIQGDFIYWSNRKSSSTVYRANKTGIEKGGIEIVLNRLTPMTVVKVVNSQSQPNAINRCLIAKCPFLCLPTEDDFKCASPDIITSTMVQPASTAKKAINKRNEAVVLGDEMAFSFLACFIVSCLI